MFAKKSRKDYVEQRDADPLRAVYSGRSPVRPMAGQDDFCNTLSDPVDLQAGPRQAGPYPIEAVPLVSLETLQIMAGLALISAVAIAGWITTRAMSEF